MQIRLSVFTWIIIAFLAGNTFGGMDPGPIQQEELSGDDRVWKSAISFLTRKKDLGEERMLSPILIPFYTPELEFGLAVGGLLSFRTDPDNDQQPRSTLRANVLGTTNEAIGFVIRLNSFWGDDTFRLNVDIGGKDAADNYYGVGYDAGFDVPEGELTTFYKYEAFAIKPVLLWRVIGDLFVGLNADLNYMNAGDVAPGMASDPTFEAFGPEYWSHGVGITLSYDTRDVTVNPWKGRLLEFNTTHYLEELGSENDFDLYSLDYREFIQLWRPGTTLALRILGEFGNGDIPWSMYPVAGGSRKLRGYSKGRFRDQAVLTGVLEYRHQFVRADDTLSKHGAAVWAGCGFLGEDIEDFDGHGLPNLGVGYRLELQERMNLRLDMGFGDDDEGVYLSINEAF